MQSEVTRALDSKDDLKDVPYDDRYFKRKTQGTARDTLIDDTPAFLVVDGNYLSACWPGDAHTLAKKFDAILKAQP
ncbi:MAG TPA: hypothetical protein VG891_08610 [Rhizomicrobium sp.]|nr:hypothetical protein [Rhizomicrobium sp.]